MPISLEAYLFCLLLCYCGLCSNAGAWGFSSQHRHGARRQHDSFADSTRKATRKRTHSSQPQRANGTRRQLNLQAQSVKDEVMRTANSAETSYPWKFTGRCIYVPALVRVNDESVKHSDLFVLNIAGWSLGGTVVLEYDTSPVGYYREWVALGGLALYSRRTDEHGSKLIGQYGSQLFVSKPDAEALCESVWGLVAQGADIQLMEEDDQESTCVCLHQQGTIGINDEPALLTASGWKFARKSGGFSFSKFGLIWTPTIKAIWACLLKLPTSFTENEKELLSSDRVLPLHRLRLAGSVRPARFDTLGKASRALSKQQKTISFGIGLAVENLVIEISPSISDP